MNPKEEIARLTALLEEANHKYYVLDAPTMADFEYDRLLRQLEELEAQYPQYASPLSPTKRVGGAALETLETAILSAQSAEIDAVAGATITSNAVKEAATAALQAAGLVQVQDAPMKAGTYTHTYRGYCSDVTVETTISDDAIAAVNILQPQAICAAEEQRIAVVRNRLILQDRFSVV